MHQFISHVIIIRPPSVLSTNLDHALHLTSGVARSRWAPTRDLEPDDWQPDNEMMRETLAIRTLRPQH